MLNTESVLIHSVSFYVAMYTIGSEKGEGLVPLKRLIPLQMFAPVLSQESDVQWLSSVYVVHTCFSFLVFI